MARRPWTTWLRRFAGTRNSAANRLTLIPNGSRRSSLRIRPGCTGGRSFVFLSDMRSLSVVINDLYVVGVTVLPDETNTVLIVDPNAVLPRSVALENFQPIAGEFRQVAPLARRVDLNQFLLGDIRDL